MMTSAMRAFLLTLGALFALTVPVSAGAGATVSAAGVPKGSYQSSCTAIQRDRDTLQAYCRTRDGSWNYTLLHGISSCRGDIRNDNGRLACSRAGAGLPSGSWRDTCRNYRVEGPVLTAECKRRNGQWIYAQIYFPACRGSINNRDGKLVCEDDRDALPSGSWIQSCRNYRMDGWVLKAECRSGRRWQRTEINTRNCREDISNQDGRLVCGSGYSLPRGSWIESCRNYGMDGRVLSAECSDNRGRWRFSELDTRGCRAPVSNQNGKLVCGEEAQLPSGSWTQSCRNYAMNGSVLEAECRDRSNRWRFSELDMRYCRQPVANVNGTLTCGEVGYGEPEIVRCESGGNKYQFCPADTRGGVDLYKQRSISPCTYGETWGFDRNGIWVDEGCRADFAIYP